MAIHSNSRNDEDVNPFAKSGSGNSTRLSPLSPDYNRGDIPVDNAKDLIAKEKELEAKEAQLQRREQVYIFGQVYMYFRGSGKAEQIKTEAGSMMQAL